MSTEPEQIGPEQRAEKLRKAGEEMAREDFVRWHKEIGQTFLKADEEPRPVEWMVDGFITFDGITLFSAKSKLGKSFLTYELKRYLRKPNHIRFNQHGYILVISES